MLLMSETDGAWGMVLRCVDWDSLTNNTKKDTAHQRPKHMLADVQIIPQRATAKV